MRPPAKEASFFVHLIKPTPNLMRINRAIIITNLFIGSFLITLNTATAQKLYLNAGIGYGLGMEKDYYHLQKLIHDM